MFARQILTDKFSEAKIYFMGKFLGCEIFTCETFAWQNFYSENFLVSKFLLQYLQE